MEQWLGLAEHALRAVAPGVPLIDRARCLPARHQGVACTTCRQVCPRQALGAGRVPDPDAYSCDGCGACVAVCPTSALGSVALAAAIEGWLVAITSDRVGSIEVKCQRVVAPEGPSSRSRHDPLVLPCLGTLRPAEILAARARGASEMTFVSADCAKCDRAPAGAAFDVAARAANEALATMGVPASIMRRTLPNDPGGPQLASGLPERLVSRRGLFTLWRDTARSAAQEVVRQAEGPADFVSRSGPVPHWRQRLESDIATLASGSVAGDGPLPPELGVGLPAVEGRCDGCGLCSLVCPFDALSVMGTDVGCRPGACTACNLCVAVCPTGGLALHPVTAGAIAVPRQNIGNGDRLALTVSEASLARRGALIDGSIRASFRRSSAPAADR